MAQPVFVIRYVENPLESASFYASLLGREPVERSPTFVLFALGPDFMLGLWSRATVAPAADIGGSGGELALALATPADVDSTCIDWKEAGVPVIQEPTNMDFGRTFTAIDPDGHRLRVFSPSVT